VTVRDEIKRRRRRALLLTIPGGVLFIAGAFLAPSIHSWFLLLLIAGFLLLGASTFYQLYGIRCPSCGERVGPLIGQPQMFAVTKPFQFCPFCGVSLDTEFEATPRPNQSLQPTAGRSDV
jgi:hypothetical protein